MEVNNIQFSHQEFFIESPLYKEFSFDGIEDIDIWKFLYRGVGLDAYCTKCEQLSVFRIESVSVYREDEEIKKFKKFDTITFNAKCSRHGDNIDHQCCGEIIICFLRQNKVFIKIGQYPSKADIDFGSLDKVFSKNLGKDLRTELGRAIGLRAHGIGVGSFVYLRRIFENFIEEAHILAKNENNWDETKYIQSKMAERIKILKGYLPIRIVNNANLYNILSKGVHELTEDECLSNFDIIQKALEMIVREKSDNKEYEELIKNINEKSSELKKPRDDSGKEMSVHHGG